MDKIFDTPYIAGAFDEVYEEEGNGFIEGPLFLPMTETSGNLINAGNGDHGFGNGVAVNSPDLGDPSIVALGGSVYYNDAGTEAHNIAGQFAVGVGTWAAWLRDDSPNSGAVYFGNVGTNQNTEPGTRAIRDSAGKLRFQVVDDAGTAFNLNSLVKSNRINYFVWAELDVENNIMRLYINDDAPLTLDITGHGGFDTQLADGRISIGNRRQSASSNIEAWIGHVRYLDSIVSDADRQSLYNNADGIGNYNDMLWRISGDQSFALPNEIVGAHKPNQRPSRTNFLVGQSGFIFEGFLYDGSNDYLTMQLAAIPTTIANWVFSCIFKTSSSKALNCFLSFDSGEYVFYLERVGGDDVLTFFRKTGAISYSVNLGVNALTDGVFHQVAFDCDGSTLEFYLGDANVGSVSCSEVITKGAGVTRYCDTLISAEDGDFTVLDETRLYEVSLGPVKSKALTALVGA